ncbi:MAG TPA: hypothetical protein VFQ65_15105, partial [Kofleriaceae bacterium]|nr:hypothetical protein [Kofleriaceae bacterium]
MARGNARAPSQNAYRGSIGRTQTAAVHVTGPSGDLVVATVYTTVDAVSDPELVDRLHSQDPSRLLNAVPGPAGNQQVAVPVVYHDPAAEVMVLVLGEAHRHREIDERIKLLERLRGDGSPIPAYAKDFAVVFGSAGLRAYLEERAHAALSQARSQDSAKDVDKKRLELASREEEIHRAKAQVEHVKAQLEQTRAQLEQARVALDRERSQLAHDRADQQRQQQEIDRLRAEQRARVIASVQVPVVPTAQTLAGVAPPADLTTPGQPMPTRPEEAEATTIGHRPQGPEEGENVTSPIELREPEPLDPIEALDHTPLPPPYIDHTGEPPPLTEISTEIHVAFDTATSGAASHKASAKANGTNGKSGAQHWPNDEESTGTAIVPQGADPLTTETQDLGEVAHDNWLDFAATGATSVFEVNDGVVRLALLVDAQQARGFRGALDMRLLLHRVTTYPIITLVIGPPAALRVPSPTQLATVTLDIGAELDRQVLGTLARRFALDVVVIMAGAPIRSVRLSAPLADNAAYILRAADDHLRGIQT